MSPEACEWPASYFEGEELWFNDWPTGEQVLLRAMALDPSKGKDARAGDYSAFVLAVIDRNLVVWLDADLERRPVDRIVRDGLNLCTSFRPDGFLLEVNQWQELLAGEFLRQNVHDLPIPLFGIENMGNKEVRIRGLTTWLAQRRLRFRRSPGCRLLVQQLRDFPTGDFDDGPDALEMAVRMLEFLYSGPGNGTGQPWALVA